MDPARDVALAIAAKEERRVHDPRLVIFSVVALHAITNVYFVMQLRHLPQMFLGIQVSAGEQAAFGAWTLVGFVFIPNAMCAIIFRVHGVLEWYVRYLGVHWVICFLHTVRSVFTNSPCNAIIPPFVRADYGAAVVCTAVDGTVALLAMVVFGLLVYVIALVSQVAEDLQDLHSGKQHHVIAQGYGTMNEEKGFGAVHHVEKGGAAVFQHEEAGNPFRLQQK